MIDQASLLPLYAAGGTPLLVLVAELATGKRAFAAGSVLLGGVATIVCAITGSRAATFCAAPHLCSWTPTPTAVVMAVLFAALTMGVMLLSLPSLRLGTAPAGEYCFLLASSMTGGVVIGYASDLISLIVGLETLTLPLYVLVGLRRFAPRERPSTRGASASVTFFLISVVSTAVALLGAALYYAATGALHLSVLYAAIGPTAPVATVGVALLVIGFAFKVAAVPLHAWAPPTYDGAPIPIAAYLSTASKLGGVLALAAVVSHLDAGPTTAVLAVLTMTMGNLVALTQTRMIRLLAWSSIAQAGYILAPLSLGAPGVRAALAYAVFFVLLDFLAFGAVCALRRPGSDGGSLAAYRGVGRHSPWPAAALVLALAGLAGLPPGLAGLFAKVTVVETLIDRGWGWLAGVVALNAVIALAYYIRVAATLYATSPATTDLTDNSVAATNAAAATTALRTAGSSSAGTDAAAAATADSGAGQTPAVTRARAALTRAVADRSQARAAAAKLAPAVVDPDLLAAVTTPRRGVTRPEALALLAAAAALIVLGFAPQLLFDALT